MASPQTGCGIPVVNQRPPLSPRVCSDAIWFTFNNRSNEIPISKSSLGIRTTVERERIIATFNSMVPLDSSV